MKTNVTDISETVKKVKITIDRAAVLEKSEKKMLELSKNAKIPGFRKGKVPLSMVRKLYEKEVLEEISGKLLDESFQNLLKERSLNPVGSLEIEKLNKDPSSSDLELVVSLEIMPDLDLDMIDKIKLKRKIEPIKGSEVDLILKEYQERHARYEISDHEHVESGDYIIFDCKATRDDGSMIARFDGKGRESHVDPKVMLEGFYKEIIGIRKGDSKSFRTALPKDYPDPELANKELNFEIKISEIKRKVLPFVDDTFAKEVSEFDTLEELRSDIRDGIKRRNESLQEAILRRELIDEILKEKDIKLPERFKQSMIKQRIEQVKERENRDKMVSRIEEDLTRGLKEHAIIASYARKRSIQVEESEINGELSRLSSLLGKEATQLGEELARSGGINNIVEQLFVDKVYKRMLTDVHIVDEVIGETDDKETNGEDKS